MSSVVGLLLAAGAGTRMGGPKALVEGVDGTPWVVSAARSMRDGGCNRVVVVTGAQAQDVRRLLAAENVDVVEATDWADGMGASLRTGLQSLDGTGAVAALVHLVDVPDVGAEVVRRMVAHARPDVLARADYGHGPAHPVLIGSRHWSGAAHSASGDKGARDYLAAHVTTAIDCADLATGVDIDEPGPMLGR